MNKSRYWMIFWGCMDLLYMSIYVIENLTHGKVPIYSDITGAMATSQSFGSYFPLLLTTLGDILYLTILLSGVMLIFGNRFGRYLSCIQALPRLYFVIPSFFPLIYISRWVGNLWIAILIIAFGEIFKIYTIFQRPK